MLGRWFRSLAQRVWLNSHRRLSTELRYRQLVENLPDGVYESLPDGRILSANSALVRMLGFASEAELLQTATAPDLYDNPRDREGYVTDLLAAGSLRNREVTLKTRDGRRITVLENSRVVRNWSGHVVCFQGTLTEITDRKRAEDELLAARDAALEASRLKSQFLANVSHELRTPLHAVLALAQLMRDSGLTAEQQEQADAIEHSALYLVDVIGQILDLSKIEAGRLELHRVPFRLLDAVEESVAMLARRAAEKDIELLSLVDPHLPELVLGDEGRLKQVLANLIMNAVRFTERGETAVRAFPVEGRPGWVRFEVKDTGPGIARHAEGALFEPFAQCDGSSTRRHGGAGLGLAIAQRLVSAMGGKLQYRTRPGCGSVFWFSIPLQPVPGCRRVANPASAVLRGRRALVACRNASARNTISAMLSHWGIHSEVAASLEPAPEPFDVILLDESLLPGLRQERPPAIHLRAGGACFLLGTPLSPQTPLPAWVRRRLLKPVRQLALQDELLRVFVPGNDGAHTGSLATLAARLDPRPAGAHGKILAAEDNAVNQVVIRRMVERLGYSIDVVPNGRQAVQALRSGSYDVVLMDCQMPEMDGFEATAEIRRLPDPVAASTPIVAVTAHAIQGDREHCLEAGMNDYLSKPLLMQDLAEALERWTCVR